MNLISPLNKGKASHDTIEVAREWLDEYGRIAIATVISTWGSAPVPVGGQLVVAPGERFEGSVSGGCIEIDVIAEAPEVMATGRLKLLEFGVADEVAWRSGLSCGGTIKILLESLNLTDAAYLDAVLAARRSRRNFLVSPHISPQVSARSSNPSLSERHARRSFQVWREQSSGHGRWPGLLLHVLHPTVRIIAVGLHVGQVLVDLARRIGYEVVIADPRTAFATESVCLVFLF